MPSHNKDVTTGKTPLDTERERLQKYIDTGEIDAETGDALNHFFDTFNADIVGVQNTSDQDTKTNTTLVGWINKFIQLARHRNLTTATTQDISNDIQALYDGSHPYLGHRCQDTGLKKSSLRVYRVALRSFYKFYDYNVSPEDIALPTPETTPIDDRDMLTRDEIHALREAADNPRDKMVVSLFLYTGQRSRALRTLRIKDIDLDDGTYRYNTDLDGLKGADKRQGGRPLLLAESAVRTWINNYHPDPQPTNYLITARPNYSKVDPTTPIGGQTARNILQKCKDNTAITKPCNPHALRHNWVTLAVKEYDYEPDEIKFAIGHSKGSNVMETTYSHISAEDYTNSMKVKAGLKEPEKEESSLTPDHCPACHEPISPDYRSCPKCGLMFTPDGATAREQLQDGMTEEAIATDTDQQRLDHEEIREFMADNEAVMIELMSELMAKKQGQGYKQQDS